MSEEYKQDQELNAKVYESAVCLKSKCEAIEKILEPLDTFCFETYPDFLKAAKSLENDSMETDTHELLEEIEGMLAIIEDASARIYENIDEISYKCNKIIEDK